MLMVVTRMFGGDKQLGDRCSGPKERPGDRTLVIYEGNGGERQSQKVGGHLFASLGGLREDIWESLLLSLHFPIQQTHALLR